jgi:hypothetical protein
MEYEMSMDKERVAELREEIAQNKAAGYHDEGIGAFGSLAMESVLDALEAAQTERDIYIEEIGLSRISEGETMTDLLETREELVTVTAERDAHWDAIEGAYREGYRQREIDEDCVKRHGPPDAGLAWTHSDARLDLLK